MVMDIKIINTALLIPAGSLCTIRALVLQGGPSFTAKNGQGGGGGGLNICQRSEGDISQRSEGEVMIRPRWIC